MNPLNTRMQAGEGLSDSTCSHIAILTRELDLCYQSLTLIKYAVPEPHCWDSWVAAGKSVHCKSLDGHDKRMSCHRRGSPDLKHTPRSPRMTTTLSFLRLARSLQAATKTLNARTLASAAAQPASAAEGDAELVRRDADPAAASPGLQQAGALMQDRITVDGRFISSPLPAPEAPSQPPNTTPRLSAYAPQVPPISDEVCINGAQKAYRRFQMPRMTGHRTMAVTNRRRCASWSTSCRRTTMSWRSPAPASALRAASRTTGGRAAPTPQASSP